jgi:hypothetical protein
LGCDAPAQDIGDGGKLWDAMREQDHVAGGKLWDAIRERGYVAGGKKAVCAFLHPDLLLFSRGLFWKRIMVYFS